MSTEANILPAAESAHPCPECGHLLIRIELPVGHAWACDGSLYADAV